MLVINVVPLCHTIVMSTALDMQIWNFSSGECLKELQAISNQEITGIICLSVSHTP